MDISTRIKELRKKHLNLTQEKFGKELGVSRDVVSNIEANRLARPEQKEPIYKLICQKFNVSEKWLKEGVGEMFIEPDVFSLDDFLNAHKATELEKNIVKAYFTLPEDTRQDIISLFKKFFNDDKKEEHSEIVNNNTITDDEIEKELESYRQELLAEQKGRISSASGNGSTNLKNKIS